MKATLCAGLLLLCGALPARAEGPTLAQARLRWLHGNYEEARDLYEKLSKEPATPGAATIGLSRVMQSKGEYTEAIALLDAAVKDGSPPAALLRRAELLYLVGRWDDAEKAADAALAADKNSFLAHWIRARLDYDRGDAGKADTHLRWFIRTYISRNENNNDIKDPDELLLVGLAGTENVRINIKKDPSLSQQLDFVLNEVYADAVKLDKDFWPADYQAGMLSLEKFRRGDAHAGFDRALKINPSAAEVLAGKGLAALQRLDVKEADQFADRALQINPQLLEGLRLKADIHITASNYADAVTVLEKARKVNPRDEATLGRLAACQYLLHHQPAVDALVKEVEAFSPKPALFYHELAQRLEDRRHFDDAEANYQKAANLRPYLASSDAALGILYMRMGREKEAHVKLEEAFKADPYNLRVQNNRAVLHHLQSYQTLPTKHFELRYDPKTDLVLARFMAIVLEDIYTDLAAQFRHEPKDKILLEVFNNHDMFSVRVISLPDLHTIGACTGRLVAMVSPHGEGVSRLFNWARVLRHEMVHIFNLEQTNFQVPHWLTEGLAVTNEGYPRKEGFPPDQPLPMPPEWIPLLIERVTANQLRTLDDIDMGFIRPSTPTDWFMAYCQSLLYVQYLKDRYGPQAISDLLAAYHDGLETPAAITRVCKDRPEFEKGYKDYVNELVKKIKGKAPEKTLSFRELREAHEKNPDDLDLSARLAEQYLVQRGNREEARTLTDAVLARQPKHALASYVRALLYLAGGENVKAQELLKQAVDEKAPEPRVLLKLAELYFEGKQPAEAAKLYELGRKAEPYEKRWLEGLARAYAESEDKARLVGVLKALVAFDPDDLADRKLLARAALATSQPAEAERYARQALEIDVLNKEVQEIFLKALEEQKKDAELERFRKVLE